MSSETIDVVGCEMPREVVPRAYLADGGIWPAGPLVPDAPPGAHLGQAIAEALRAAMERQRLGARELSRLTGSQVTHPTVMTVLQGSRLPSVHTVLLLEVALKAPLYPAGLHAELADGQEP
ncbi:helix-turn-helix transcriptional regulator [Kitasatospora sp. NA04385]|uniref:helix-turn-helix transcriptional regulator n=1 Tax=Kitasatospora sp. NA04385 TaxID=2742135 RepID=UPI001590587B|nr:helix-turn-helix transcriptional regulator [Kitasatospora sp. NA04385]QKW20550.1 helix-turn-helix transcriptional regulator [Kitasatospora sp. NA04385]